jgi:tRNA(fMet)-specific endonuclease VapC
LNLILDTVAVIARLNEDQAIIALLSGDVRVHLPIIVLGELYVGAENSSRVQENMSRIDAFARNAYLLSCDQDTAKQYARIGQQLRLRGRPIPQNDMWIAALAMQHGLTLLTRDYHFDEITGLLKLSW